MDTRLRLYIDALRALADQPASEFNRVMGERYIDQYLQAKDASPELLKAAINAEGDDPFWIMMQEYVHWRSRRPI